MGVLVIDTDIASLIWRDALPDELDQQLLGRPSLIAACCVTHDLPLMTRNRKHFEPLEPLGLDLL